MARCSQMKHGAMSLPRASSADTQLEPMLDSLFVSSERNICMSDLNFLSAVSMAEQVRQKKTSPVELVEAHLQQIERLNPSLNAFVHIDTDRPRRDARAAEAAVMSGKTLGPLHGVPVSIKSSINVAGLRCEAGTRLRAGFVASEDAPLVERLRNAGAIVLGVTNTPELLIAKWLRLSFSSILKPFRARLTCSYTAKAMRE